MSEIPRWPRRHYAEGGGQPYLFWAVFGCFEPLALDRELHRSRGVPDGVRFERVMRGDPRDPAFLFRDTWAEVARQDHPGLLDTIRRAPERILLQGTVIDGRSLDYLRDAVGVVSCLLDRGGLAVADVLAYKWWSPEAFQQQLFHPNRPMPFQHVSILSSPEAAGSIWLHTRGMRLYGRPDVSVHGVAPDEIAAVVEMINRFIAASAEGIIVEQGEHLEMELLSGEWVCHHRGDLDDPAFNNVHLEVVRS